MVEEKSYFLKIDGGAGRCIASTGAIEKFAETHPTNVVTSYPFCFTGLKNVKRIYPLQVQSNGQIIATPFLYEDKIRNGIYLEPEPYNDFAYYNEGKHISQVFNKLLNGVDEFVQPKLELSLNELFAGKQIVNKIKGNSKGVILLQPFAQNSGLPISATEINQDETYRSMSYEFAKKLTDALVNEKYEVVWVKAPNQMGYMKAKGFDNNFTMRQVFALIKYVDGVIGVDSFLLHACAGIQPKCPVFAFWGATKPSNVGYKEHINFVGKEGVEDEPNRIPHDHQYYLNMNKDANNYTDEMINEIIAKLKEAKE